MEIKKTVILPFSELSPSTLLKHSEQGKAQLLPQEKPETPAEKDVTSDEQHPSPESSETHWGGIIQISRNTCIIIHSALFVDCREIV